MAHGSAGAAVARGADTNVHHALESSHHHSCNPLAELGRLALIPLRTESSAWRSPDRLQVAVPALAPDGRACELRRRASFSTERVLTSGEATRDPGVIQSILSTIRIIISIRAALHKMRK